MGPGRSEVCVHKTQTAAYVEYEDLMKNIISFKRHRSIDYFIIHLTENCVLNSDKKSDK